MVQVIKYQSMTSCVNFGIKLKINFIFSNMNNKENIDIN